MRASLLHKQVHINSLAAEHRDHILIAAHQASRNSFAQPTAKLSFHINKENNRACRERLYRFADS